MELSYIDEAHRPSLQKEFKAKTLPFASSLYHVKNINMMLQCEHCGRWRLLYSQYKLSKKERADLQAALEDLLFTCGSPLQELDLPGRLSSVYVQDIVCEEPIEWLYCKAKYPPICVYCACTLDIEFSEYDQFYPQCCGCHQPKLPVT